MGIVGDEESHAAHAPHRAVEEHTLISTHHGVGIHTESHTQLAHRRQLRRGTPLSAQDVVLDPCLDLQEYGFIV